MGSIKTRREIVVEKYLKEQVEKIGGKCLKMLPTYDAGVPDRLVLYKGQTVFVETKRQGLSPSKLQAIFMSQLNVNGFETRVIDEKSQVDELIREIQNRADLKAPCPIGGESPETPLNFKADDDAAIWAVSEFVNGSIIPTSKNDKGVRVFRVTFNAGLALHKSRVLDSSASRQWIRERLRFKITMREIVEFENKFKINL